MRLLPAILASATLLSAQTAPYVPKQSDRPEVLTVVTSELGLRFAWQS